MSKNKEETERSPETISVIVGLLVIVLGMTFFAFDPLEVRPGRQAFCQEEGYNKTTDIIALNGLGGEWSTYAFECDNKVIYKGVTKWKSCKKQNKWDQCISYSTRYSKDFEWIKYDKETKEILDKGNSFE